jgi:Circadian oscillating protein COP23
MNLKSWIDRSLVSVLSLSMVLLSKEPVYSQQTTFSCGDSNGIPATIAHSPKHGDVPIIEWVSNYFADSGYDPQTRCNQVSARFQEYSDRGELKYLTTGRINDEPVICAKQAEDRPCNLLFTIKKISSPGETLQRLLNIRSDSSSPALKETNEQVLINFNILLEEKAGALSTSPQASPSQDLETDTNPNPNPEPISDSNPDSLF